VASAAEMRKTSNIELKGKKKKSGKIFFTAQLG